MFLINCGGLINLTEILGLDDETGDHCILYVLDSHRPFYLENLSDENVKVVILADGAENIPNLEQFESFSDHESDEERDDDDDDDEDEQITDSERARRSRSRARINNRRELIRSYYASTSYGMSASLMAFELALMLGQEKQVKIIWSAILGLTDQLIHERIDYPIYDLSINELNGQVAAINTEEINLSIENANIHRSANDSQTVTRASTSTKSGSISFIKHEPRLIHFRHSSLFDSLSWSPFISSRLRRYTPDGDKHIKTILLELSISQSSAKSDLMSRDTWMRFDREIENVIQIHPRLRELRIPTFIRQLSSLCKVTAIDVIYLASALLEQPQNNHKETTAAKSQRKNNSNEIINGSRNKRIKLDEIDQIAEEFPLLTVEEFNRHQMECWWQAYDLCDNRDSPHIPRAFALSKSSLRSFNRIALNLVARKGFITKTGPFRYLIIDDQPELAAILHPHAIQRLGSLILDCLIEQSEKSLMMEITENPTTNGGETITNDSTRRPLIIANFLPSLNRYLVIGIAGTMRMTEARSENRFGVAFRSAANGIQAKHFKHDQFETSYLEIGKESLKPFIEFLHTELINI